MVCQFKRIDREGHAIGYGWPLARLSLLPYDIEEGLFSQPVTAPAVKAVNSLPAIFLSIFLFP
jgi:hypothetical protein